MVQRRTRWNRLLAIVLAAALVASCGGDDDGADDDAAGVEDTTENSDDGDDAGDSGSGGDCDNTDAGGSTHTGASFTGTSAAAASVADGAAYTLYVADFEVDTDSFSMVSSPEVPDDGIMWTIAVTIFNAAEEDIIPLEVGEVVEAGKPFGELTFTVTVDEGADFSGNSLGEEGTVTITSVGDMFCGTIDYSDDEKSISGSFAAPVKAL